MNTPTPTTDYRPHVRADITTSAGRATFDLPCHDHGDDEGAIDTSHLRDALIAANLLGDHVDALRLIDTRTAWVYDIVQTDDRGDRYPVGSLSIQYGAGA